MNEIDYAARVAKGVALLDEKRPGWERLLDLDTLDIASSHACVTAQLSGVRDFMAGMNQLGLTLGSGGTYIGHGFNAESCGSFCDGGETCEQDSAYATLNTLWKAVITTRLASGEEQAT